MSTASEARQILVLCLSLIRRRIGYENNREDVVFLLETRGIDRTRLIEEKIFIRFYPYLEIYKNENVYAIL